MASSLQSCLSSLCSYTRHLMMFVCLFFLSLNPILLTHKIREQLLKLHLLLCDIPLGVQELSMFGIRCLKHPEQFYREDFSRGPCRHRFCWKIPENQEGKNHMSMSRRTGHLGGMCVTFTEVKISESTVLLLFLTTRT